MSKVQFSTSAGALTVTHWDADKKKKQNHAAHIRS